jgi:chloramphenicol 3-O phosphotransferase
VFPVAGGKGETAEVTPPGTIVVLNGPPRSGKTSIVSQIQDSFPGIWMNLGVDVFSRQVTPARFRPGIGLRPGGERPDLEAVVPALYAALYESIAAHSRQGLNVVADLDHHDAYSRPLGLLADAARRLEGLPAWLVGVRCALEVIVERRADTWGEERVGPAVPDHVRRWESAVHHPGIYDLEVDTSLISPSECASAIADLLASGTEPLALRTLAAGS